MKQNNLKKMEGLRVLVTGGLGFIGSNIAHKLAGLGADVEIFDALLPECGGNPANIKEIREKVCVTKGDIRNFDEIKKAVNEKNLIFNCAAQISHIGSMRNPFLDVDINCRGQMTLLEAVRQENDSAKIIFSATSSQVGKMLYSPIDEMHPEFPVDIYSADKSVGEKYHLIYHNAYGIPVSSIRLSNTYGPRALVKSADVGVINYFIGLALQGKEITLYEPGAQTRQALFVEDAANAMILAAQKKEAVGEIFFACPAEKNSLKEISDKIVEIVGKGSVKFVPWPENRRGIEIGDVFISNKKISETLGWQPEDDLASGLEKTVNFYKGRLGDYL